jgi:hypothetical protein
MSLNPNQERAVAVTLRLLEERLAEIQQLMEVDERGILYHLVADFTPEQQVQMNQVIAELGATIKSVAETFHLPRDEQSPARKIMGLLSVSWESLGDIRSRQLRAYGEVDPELKETLDPYVQKLTRLVLALEDVALGRK